MDIMGIAMQVFFYKSSSGKSPVREFIDKQPNEDQARILEVIDEIESHGFSGVRVNFKPIEGKLWEIKFKSSGGGYRVFYVLLEKDSMVWLHAIKKKTQKTPQRDIKTARRRMMEVLK